MRRLLSFSCEALALGATLDEADGATGLLIVTGGSQTRIGSHRMFERLAAALAAEGFPCFRFDRRGVGDSEGEDPGYRGSGPDLMAAAAAFRRECPQLRQVIGFGLCDGATALALFGAEAGLNGLILANPWFVESEAGTPPPAAIRRHYRDRLLSLAGWKELLSGSVSYRKIVQGVMKIASARPSSLAAEIALNMRQHRLPAAMILARRDATAIAAEEIWQSADFRELRGALPPVRYIDSDSHTFARPGDPAALAAAVLAALRP